VILALLAILAPHVSAGTTYRLESAHTRVAFEVERFGIQWVAAHFREVSGEFAIDRGGGASRIDVSVPIASVECNDPRWNARLLSSEWLDAQHYPFMTYRAERILLGDDWATATGLLTLHGVTREVVLSVSLHGCEPSGDCQFAAHARIRRSDFGLPHGFWSGGDQVQISIGGTVERTAS